MKWRLACIPVCLVAVGLCSGCVSKAKARRDAQAAFVAGQQEAALRIQQQGVQGPRVTVSGPVKNGIIPWTEDLTLIKAIAEAEYTAHGNPAEIFLVRAGRAFRFDPRDILAGRDVPLEPGDLIQLNVNPVQPNTPR
jgi:hypothetical protein